MKCNTNKYGRKTEPTLELQIDDDTTGRICIVHLPLRFKKYFDDLNISDSPKTSKDYDLSKPIKSNNASALQKFSEIILELTPQQITTFSTIAANGYPETIADLLAIALEAGEYKCLYAHNYYTLARGFVNFMRNADPDAGVCQTKETEFEDFGKYIVSQTGGFFFKGMYFYK